MNENDRRSGDVKIFGITFRRLTLNRITGGVFALLGLSFLVEAFLSNDSVFWWKLGLGILTLGGGILCLFAPAADTKDT